MRTGRPRGGETDRFRFAAAEPFESVMRRMYYVELMNSFFDQNVGQVQRSTRDLQIKFGDYTVAEMAENMI